MKQNINIPTRVGRLRVHLGHALWVFPGVATVVGLVLAAFVSEYGNATPATLVAVLTTGGPEGARDTVKIIASASLAATTLVFSLTVVALQIAASQYSPRLPRQFLRDRSTQAVMGLFILTFVYSLAVLRSIDASAEFVPQQAVTLSFLLGLAVVGAFVYFIHHIVHAIRVEQILNDIETKTVAALRRNHVRLEQSDPRPEKPVIPERAVPILVHRSGVIQRFDAADLVDTAQHHDVVIRFVRLMGQHVVADAPLAWAWTREEAARPPDPEELRPEVLEVVQLGAERTLQADVAFGIIQLVDVALRAVSPAVNDPTTACTALQYSAVVLVQLCRYRLGDELFHDPTGHLRVAIPRRAFPAYLEMVVAPMRRACPDDVSVMLSLMEMLADVGRAALDSDEQRDAVSGQLETVVRACTDAVPEKSDRQQLEDAADEVERALAGEPPRQP